MPNIYALSSGAPPCAIAIIRLSGKDILSAVKKITNITPKARYMHYCDFKDSIGDIIDHGMLVFFPSPNSFTGEDCAEFYIHGSKATINKMLDELSLYPGFRPAEAGEFSRKAFLNGKIDLVEAEYLADLLEAENESQRRLSIMGTSKKLSKQYEEWRRQIIEIMAYLTAELDFPDEEEIIELDNKPVWHKLKSLKDQIAQHIKLAENNYILQNGLKIALIGKPNSGKSSLINKLSGKDLSIVSSQRGTTRDIIEAKLNLQGVDVFIYDTAGITETDNEIEKIGIEKAKKLLEESDLVFYLTSCDQNINSNGKTSINSDLAIEYDIKLNNYWLIHTKSDLLIKQTTYSSSEKKEFYISIYNDKSIKDLIYNIEEYIKQFLPKYGTILPAKNRHIYLLREAIDNLDKALIYKDLPIELRLEYIRASSNNLAKITGKIDIENILDVIFSQFCIGK